MESAIEEEDSKTVVGLWLLAIDTCL
jgi:hypothetical protein